MIQISSRRRRRIRSSSSCSRNTWDSTLKLRLTLSRRHMMRCARIADQHHFFSSLRIHVRLDGVRCDSLVFLFLHPPVCFRMYEIRSFSTFLAQVQSNNSCRLRVTIHQCFVNDLCWSVPSGDASCLQPIRTEGVCRAVTPDASLLSDCKFACKVLPSFP